jgi:Leucine-rich repeat (LRR) protein
MLYHPPLPTTPTTIAARGNCLDVMGNLNLGHLKSLVRLQLQHADLVGRIPPELGDLIGLQNLDLRANRLQGEIPVEMGRLHNLRELFLDNNQLSGTHYCEAKACGHPQKYKSGL